MARNCAVWGRRKERVARIKDAGAIPGLRDSGNADTGGALTRGSRVATNVYHVLDAAKGKDVLFFPARFDAHEVQAADGYAYHIAVQAFNAKNGKSPPFRTFRPTSRATGGAGRGAARWRTPRLRASSATRRKPCWRFPPFFPARIARIALVDFDNDCVGTSSKHNGKKCSASTWP